MLSAYKAYHSSSPMAFAYKYTISVSTLPVADLEGVPWNPSFLRAVKDWELFCPCTPLIKTVMRLFTAGSNYSQLWLCSIDYDSH